MDNGDNDEGDQGADDDDVVGCVSGGGCSGDNDDDESSLDATPQARQDANVFFSV